MSRETRTPSVPIKSEQSWNHTTGENVARMKEGAGGLHKARDR